MKLNLILVSKLKQLQFLILEIDLCKLDLIIIFYEANKALNFDREVTHGMRLDIPAGTAIRFEPGDTTDVKLVPYTGLRIAHGFNSLVNGSLDN